MKVSDLYEEFEARLRRHALSLVRDSDSADDLVQETFIRATANLTLLEHLNRHQRRAWRYRVIRNVFIDGQRARKRQEELVEQLTREAEIAPFTLDDLSSTDLLEMVPEPDRDLLEQRYVQGMTSREIASDLGIPPATVRSRLRLALKRLRELHLKEGAL